jgi:fimbrial isopeptide formation D2 family protein
MVVKPGGTTTPTIGERVTYRVTATVPADVTLYQASVIDTLPRGLDPASVVLEGGTITCTPSCTVGSTPLTPATSGSSTRIGWSLGTLAPSAEVRTLTVEYSAKVADLSGPFPVAGVGSPTPR